MINFLFIVKLTGKEAVRIDFCRNAFQNKIGWIKIVKIALNSLKNDLDANFKL